MRLFIIALSLLITVACNSDAQSQDNSYKVLTQEEFKSKLVDADNYYLIDVRTEQEFNQGTIEGAINYDILDGTLQANLKELDKTKTVFVFCAKGSRSAKAGKILESNGFKVVYDLEGGYSSWDKK